MRLVTLIFSMADKFVRSGYLNFVDKGHMYEKYDATNPIRVGGGGEYEVQLGFGWTNLSATCAKLDL